MRPLHRRGRQRGLHLLTPEERDRGPLAMVKSTDAPKLVAALAKEGILARHATAR